MVTSVLIAFSSICFVPENRVRLERTRQGYQILRNGKPYFIRGAGAQKNLKELAAAGGNSIRTWGIDNKTQKTFDECHKLGLTVTGGFWLMKAGDGGFNYNNSSDRKRQFDSIQMYVRKYKNHPALLMWAIGNEMELGLPEDQIQSMWTHVNDIAAMIKKEDPGRPVLSVVADMWPAKMDAILKFAPNLDLLGINSYTGLPTLHQRMQKWTKPYLITEFQHPIATDGMGEPLGLPKEPSSTEKAAICKRDYLNCIQKFPGRVLGSYVFYWDASGTQTSSWYNMHLKTGERLGSVEVMQQLWTGKSSKNRVPIIRTVKSTQAGKFIADVVDPDRDNLQLTLEVVNEDQPRFSGDFEQQLKVAYKQKVSFKFSLPKNLPGGRYRAYLICRDGKGNAAVWNTVYDPQKLK